MRLHRFYIRNEGKFAIGDRIVVESLELVHQVRNVFRLGDGDRITVFNGTGFDYECKIDGFEKKNKIRDNSVINLTVLDSKRNNIPLTRRLFLAASIVKKDNFEWIVEKATELGVTDIIPIIAERSEKKSLNEERLRAIAIEASEQSGRDTTPMVYQIMGLGSAVNFLKRGVNNEKLEMLAFHTEGKKLNGLSARVGPAVAVFIGPEGGWSSAEVETFHENGIDVVCLGPRILRTETAAIATLSLMMLG